MNIHYLPIADFAKTFRTRMDGLDAYVRHISDFVTLDISDGPWIAGGSIVSYITHSTYNDIDIFCPTFGVSKTVIDELDRQCKVENVEDVWGGVSTASVSFPLRYKSEDTDIDYLLRKLPPSGENVMYEMASDKTLIQVVRSHVHSTIEELFNSFDFHACQFATDGDWIAFTDGAYNSIDKMILTLSKAVEPSLFVRMAKYSRKGFDYDVSLIKNALREHEEDGYFRANPGY